MRSKRYLTTLLAASIGASSLLACQASLAGAKNAAPALFDKPPAAQPAAVGGPNFAPIVREFGPTVVHVNVRGEATAAAGPDLSQIPPQLRNSPFFQFFQPFQSQPQREVPTRGLGSGFIIGSDGLILTNAHVVKDAKSVTVTLTDHRAFKATVLGTDAKTDIAVLKIPATNLPTVRVGNPNNLQPGDWVLAIGSPYGFYNTVTAGIVSAKSRSLPDDSMVPFIQTDVAVNPGNSGGPLFNTKGEVVGINSQIFTQTGAFEGLSFAIPINVAETIARQIIAHGHVEHGKLGITVQTVSQQLAQSFGLSNPRGALVASVDDGSPAAKAGVKPGDIILSVNGQPINDSTDLPMVIGMMQPGSAVKLGVWSNRREVNLDAKLGSFTRDVLYAEGGAGGAAQGLGLQVRPLKPAEAQQAGVHAGLVIENVSGPAEAAGVQNGDILLAVDGKPVSSVDQVRAILKGAGKTIALLIERGGNRIFVPVEIG
ncbi:putative periplasmic serine endoprotease DegP-like precursor [mine drainage metagenome]|jgi:serine protease Do|uniref:Probable periplasmic serine endoprotease DegP-like n=1 Tax=mine drainage metagenome TaxID=410659 RepID=A0A1J5QQN7_9ZZZZ